MEPAKEIPQETDQCLACKGTGKAPFQGKCLRCQGVGKLTKAQMDHARWSSKLLDKTLKAADEAD